MQPLSRLFVIFGKFSYPGQNCTSGPIFFCLVFRAAIWYSELSSFTTRAHLRRFSSIPSLQLADVAAFSRSLNKRSTIRFRVAQQKHAQRRLKYSAVPIPQTVFGRSASSVSFFFCLWKFEKFRVFAYHGGKIKGADRKAERHNGEGIETTTKRKSLRIKSTSINFHLSPSG